MNNLVRKSAAGILTVLVLFFTILGILGIWGLIDIENFFSKTMSTLLVLFVSSAIILFLYAVVFKGDDMKTEKKTKKETGSAPETFARGSRA